MAKIIKGDITKIEKGVILHQANCMGVMGKGVALAIKNKWFRAFTEYKTLCNELRPDELFGGMQIVDIKPDLYVIHSFSQLDYNRKGQTTKHTNEEYLIENIKKTIEFADNLSLPVFIPKYVGCGLAKGDWNIVYNAIKDLDVTIIDYRR